MKLKLFNLLGASLASIGLLAPLPRALASSVELSTAVAESPYLERNLESRRALDTEWTHNQGLLEQERASKNKPITPVAVAAQTTAPNQKNLARRTEQVSNLLGAIIVTFVFIGYVSDELFYRKHRISRAAILLQQIETLEKIWKMPPQHRSDNSH